MPPTKPEPIDSRSVPRKKYEAPRLETYGNIHQITQTLGNHGKTDGGIHNMSKTG
jgi:hypothetical protein